MKRKIILLTVCMMMVLPLSLVPVKALSFWVSASTTSVKPGQYFTVTVGGDFIGRVNLSVSNGSLTSYSLWIEGNSAVVGVNAGSAGTTTVSATTELGTSDINGNEIPVTTRSTSVAVVKPSSGNGGSSSGGSSNGGNASGGSSSPIYSNGNTENQPKEVSNKSNINLLSSLSVSQGKLTPSFNENVTNYKVEVAADVNKIKIDAKAKDLKAQVNGIGEKSLEAGDNVFHIDVTAENGAVKTYTITVAVDEKPLIYVKYDNQQLGVVRNLKGVSIPANFHETTIKIEGKKVKAWENGILKKKIVYLSNEENEKNFYVFDEKKGITSIFVPMAILGNNVYYLGIPKNLQKRVGMQYEEVNVDQQKMMGWTFKDKSFANYTLIYVMDQKGTMKYYLHEKEENTLQLYSNAAATTQKHYEKLVSDYEKTEKTKILFMILSGIFAVTTLFGVWTILHNKRKN